MRPAASEQIKIFKEHVTNIQFSTNEYAYLISMKWLQKWYKSVGFYNNAEPTNDCPPIDNKDLVTEDGENRRVLMEGINHFVVKKDLWDLFVKWYGGGPEIKVEVVFDPIRKQNVPDVHPLTIRIFYIQSAIKKCSISSSHDVQHANNNRDVNFITMQFSKYKTADMLRNMICEKLQISPSKFCLFMFTSINETIDTNSTNKSRSNDLRKANRKKLEGARTLSEYHILNNQQLILDVDNDVPRNINLYKTSPDNRHQIQIEIEKQATNHNDSTSTKTVILKANPINFNTSSSSNTKKKHQHVSNGSSNNSSSFSQNANSNSSNNDLDENLKMAETNKSTLPSSASMMFVKGSKTTFNLPTSTSMSFVQSSILKGEHDDEANDDEKENNGISTFNLNDDESSSNNSGSEVVHHYNGSRNRIDRLAASGNPEESNFNTFAGSSRINGVKNQKNSAYLIHGPTQQIGICGFVNLGNTCFFNSSLQSLLHTMPLVNHFLNDQWKSEMSLTNKLGTKGACVTAFSSIVERVWAGLATSIAPRHLFGVIQRYAPHFSGYAQQDAHELLLFLLDMIHEDLNRVKVREEIKEREELKKQKLKQEEENEKANHKAGKKSHKSHKHKHKKKDHSNSDSNDSKKNQINSENKKPKHTKKKKQNDENGKDILDESDSDDSSDKESATPKKNSKNKQDTKSSNSESSNDDKNEEQNEEKKNKQKNKKNSNKPKEQESSSSDENENEKEKVSKTPVKKKEHKNKDNDENEKTENKTEKSYNLDDDKNLNENNKIPKSPVKKKEHKKKDHENADKTANKTEKSSNLDDDKNLNENNKIPKSPVKKKEHKKKDQDNNEKASHKSEKSSDSDDIKSLSENKDKNQTPSKKKEKKKKNSSNENEKESNSNKPGKSSESDDTKSSSENKNQSSTKKKEKEKVVDNNNSSESSNESSDSEGKDEKDKEIVKKKEHKKKDHKNIDKSANKTEKSSDLDDDKNSSENNKTPKSPTKKKEHKKKDHDSNEKTSHKSEKSSDSDDTKNSSKDQAQTKKKPKKKNENNYKEESDQESEFSDNEAKKNTDDIEEYNGNDDEYSQKAWNIYKSHNDSIVVDTFHGLLRSKIRCPNCKSSAVMFDPFVSISLPITRHNQLYQICFVPYDTRQSQRNITLPIPFNSSKEVFEVSLFTEIGRTCRVVYAQVSESIAVNNDNDNSNNSNFNSQNSNKMIPKSHSMSALSFSSSSEYMTQNSNLFVSYSLQYTSIEVIASPVPPFKSTKTYVLEVPDEINYCAIARLAVKVKGLVNSSVKHLNDLYIVEIPSENPTKEEVSSACKKRFGYLWNNRSEKDVKKDIHKKLKNENFAKEFLACRQLQHLLKGKEIASFKKGDQCLKVKTNTYGHKFPRFKQNPIISSSILSIIINGKFMNEASGFNYQLLFRPSSVSSRLSPLPHPHKNLNVDYSNKKKQTLEDLLRMFTSPTLLDEDNKWYCPKCKEFVCADKKLDIWSMPKCFIVNFKRFAARRNNRGYKKIETNIEFDEIVDFSPFVVGQQSRFHVPQNKKVVDNDNVNDTICDEKEKNNGDGEQEVQNGNKKMLLYKLYAVIHHNGQLNGGHYTAHSYVESQNKWFFFNDTVVKESTQQAAHQSSAYILFYQRIDDDDEINNIINVDGKK